MKRRGAWFEEQLDLDPERLVFIDETWASTSMARTHGRCRRGERLRVGVPHGHWKTTTFIAGLTTRGMIAPFVLDGPINRSAFETYVERVVVPELRQGDIVVMDNLSSHKGPRVREMFEAAGASLLFLPRYSPDFNPIEKVCNRIVEQSIETFGRVDVLVNNAGGSPKGALSELPLEHWRYTFDLCVTSAFLASQAVVQHLISRGAGGSIINTSSVHSTHVWPNSAAYGAAKAALNRLTMSMAVEWANRGIRANAIAPGYVNTSETEEEKERYAAGDNTSAPLTAQRTARLSEIAQVAVLLASDEASYMTGQTIFADGGLLLPVITTADFIRGDRIQRTFVG